MPWHKKTTNDKKKPAVPISTYKIEDRATPTKPKPELYPE